MPLLPPEARLLLLATAPRREGSDRELVTLLRSPLRWEFIGRLAEREKLLPVLWKAIQPYAKEIPDEFVAAVRRQASVTEFRMLMTETVLRRIVEQLAAQGARVMLLKGAALATTIYSSFAERPMGDLDILVAPSDAQRAWKQMRAVGWTLELSGGAEFHDSHHHLPGLLDPGGLSVVLEIHRTMLPRTGPFILDETDLWRDARTVRLGTSEAWVLSDQHQLLHLCVHFAWSHMLIEGLGRTARDVATLLAAGSVSWPEFMELAVRTKAATCAYWTLALSQTLAGASVPMEVLEALRPRQPRALTHALERAYVTSGLLRACPSLHLSRALWRAGILPTSSGHGPTRPWDVSDMFKTVFHLGRPASFGGRVVEHARHLTSWIQFAEVLGVPRRVL
jgi:putative nucleotidyltransferase-like protein